MSFLRPEVAALWRRWQGVAIGAVLVLAGAYALVVLGGPAGILGAALVLGGLAVGGPALLRARFRPGGDGEGVVDLTERQLAYFHPRGGAAISLDAVRLIEIRVMPRGTPPQPQPFWAFHHDDGPPLVIPANAAGADRLIDVLAGFPGADTARVVAAGQSQAPAGFTIWRREAAQHPALSRTPPPA